MNVSAQVRYVDYAVRPLHSKNRRRSNEDSLLRHNGDPRPEDEQLQKAPQEPYLAFDDDDDGLGYSLQSAAPAATTARKDMVPETVRPTLSLQGTAALLTLITSGDGRQRDPVVVVKRTARGDAFYDLLDQVIAKT